MSQNYSLNGKHVSREQYEIARGIVKAPEKVAPVVKEKVKKPVKVVRVFGHKTEKINNKGVEHA